MADIDELVRLVTDNHQANMGRHDRTNSQIQALEQRQLELEQRSVGRRGGGDGLVRSLGAQVVDSDAYRAWQGAGFRGRHSIEVKSMTSAIGSGGALITPDRDPGIVLLPRRRLTVRSLLAPGETKSNSVEFVRQTGFTNNATVVSEGAQKPETDITFATDSAPVRTIAHWIPVSRQVADDAPALMSIIDSELTYGLDLAEEDELLNGDGTGQHLNGLIAQATAYDTSRDEAGDTRLDTIHHALAQAEEAELPATGIILNTNDWMSMSVIKDNEGRYIGGGPFGSDDPRLWGKPVAYTTAIDEGDFLVGAFGTAAQIFDRMGTEVLVSDEDRDNFIKNMLTVRAERRLALVVRRGEALIHGSFPLVSG